MSSAKKPPNSARRESESRYSLIVSSLARHSSFLDWEISSSLSLSTFFSASVYSSASSKSVFIRSNFFSMATFQAFSSPSSASNASALALTQSTIVAQDTQRSIRPFIMSTPYKHPKPRLERMNMQYDRKERQTDKYLSQTKEARLPYGLIRMVAQVFIIFARDDR